MIVRFVINHKTRIIIKTKALFLIPIAALLLLVTGCDKDNNDSIPNPVYDVYAVGAEMIGTVNVARLWKMECLNS
ncbi:hypothetical protein [Gelidibacter japonicus]|uniref:hypothetical protein n=1 Tax=Gelidibacter japonicus TaxID=1962232 RepID=UPI003A8D5179